MREKSHWSDEIRNEKTRKIETNRKKRETEASFRYMYMWRSIERICPNDILWVFIEHLI